MHFDITTIILNKTYLIFIRNNDNIDSYLDI